MRETVTEYEVETVEKEQEIVYCDVCAAQCTATHEVVPMELCPSCQPEEGEQEWTMDTYQEAFEESDVKQHWEDKWLFIVLFPIFSFAAVLDLLDGAEYAKFFILPVLGLLFWSGILLGFYMLSFL